MNQQRKVGNGLLVFLLFLLIGAVNLNSIKSPFHFDDDSVIKDNRGLTKLSNFKYIFQRVKYYELFAERSYRPVTSALYLILKQVFDDNPVYWRLFNLLVHLINCSLLYLIFCRLRLAPKLSVLAVALFAVHTVHSEIINVISFNEELLGGFFCLLAFYCYITGGFTRKLLSVLFYFLSCQIKEVFIVLPALCLLFSFFVQDGKTNWGRLIIIQLGYLVAALLLLFINFRLMSDPNTFLRPIYPGGELSSALLTFGVALNYYWKIFFLPLGLSPIYNFTTYHSLTEQPVMLALIHIAIIGGLIVYGFKQGKTYPFYLCWFYLFLLPTSNLIPYGGIKADRYLYFPLMGLVPGVLLFAQLLLKRISLEKVLLPLGLAFLLLLSIFTVQRNVLWQNEGAIWEDALNVAPDNAIPLQNLAAYYYNEKDMEKAIKYYQLTIKADPMQPVPYRSLGMIFWGKKKLLQARIYFEAAVSHKRGFLGIDDYYFTLIDLGAVCLAMKDYEAAKKYWELARKDQPMHPTAHYNLAIVYKKLGNKQAAKKTQRMYRMLTE